MKKAVFYLLLSVVTLPVSFSQGIITTIAGNGITQYIGDGWPATSYSLAQPTGLCMDKSGDIYETDYAESRIRRLDTHDTLYTYAGIGVPGYTGDGGPASTATFANPTGVAMDTAGNLYITEEYNHIVRKITRATGIVSTICGTGVAGYAGDGGSAMTAMLNQPAGLCLDKAGNIYIADKNNNRIRKIDALTGTITSFAGIGSAGYSGDGGPANTTKLAYPMSVCADTANNIYIADNANHRIRRVDAATGTITTVTGMGGQAYTGDEGQAIYARISEPNCVHMSKRGNLYISDYGNNVIRVITPDGIIHTVAGSGLFGYSGDGGPALSATFQRPTAICTDNQENLYIADGENSAIRKVTPVYTGITISPSLKTASIYPNPANTRLCIAGLSPTARTNVKIINALGVTIIEKTDFFGQPIELTAIAPGLYILSIQSENEIRIEKLIIQR